MKRLLIFINFVCAALSLFSQTDYFKQAAKSFYNDDSENAIRLQTIGLKQIEKSIGKDNISYINALYDLAIYYSYIEKDEIADEIFHQIENASLTLDDEDNYNYFDILNKIATYYEDIIDYDQDTVSLSVSERRH